MGVFFKPQGLTGLFWSEMSPGAGQVGAGSAGHLGGSLLSENRHSNASNTACFHAAEDLLLGLGATKRAALDCGAALLVRPEDGEAALKKAHVEGADATELFERCSESC